MAGQVSGVRGGKDLGEKAGGEGWGLKWKERCVRECKAERLI